ncbi:MAG: ABC transporter substrate-binding protein [Actinomycetota bacterium]|nr:ABC transporter substrate-binding protein [Actinomycetota bacterium]
MRRALAFGIALLLVLAACAPATQEPLLIGAVYPTGAPLGEEGLQEYRGVKLAADLANQEGGVGGRPIKLLLEAANSAEAGPEAVKRLSNGGAKVIVGSYSSVVSRTAARTASDLGLVFWETGAVGEVGMSPSISERVFRFAPTGASLGRAAISFVRDQVASKVAGPAKPRYSVVFVDDVYGRSVASGAIDEINRSGLPLASAIGYDLQTVDYGRITRDLIASGTDVLMVVAYLEDGVALRRAVVEAKVPLMATIGTSSSYCHPAFGQMLGEDALGVFASDKPDADVVDPAALDDESAERLKWARERYTSLYSQPMSAAALAGFSAGWALFHHVLPRAAAQTPDAVAEAARTVRLEAGALPNGSGLSFSSSKDHEGINELATSVIWQWVEPGVRAVVWPPTFATRPVLALR